jgi:hypothetical protein
VAWVDVTMSHSSHTGHSLFTHSTGGGRLSGNTWKVMWAHVRWGPATHAVRYCRPYLIDKALTRCHSSMTTLTPLGAPGQGLLNFACGAKTGDGSTYLLHGISELERHPTDPNACLVKNVGYDDGLVGRDLEHCSPYGELRGPGIVQNVRVHTVGGRRRCVVDLATGATPQRYSVYEIEVRDRAVMRTAVYRRLLAEYEALLELVRLAEIQRDQLKAYIVKRKQQLQELTARVEHQRARVNAQKDSVRLLQDAYAREQQLADDAAAQLARMQAQRNSSAQDIARIRAQTAELLRQVDNVRRAPAHAPSPPPAPPPPVVGARIYEACGYGMKEVVLPAGSYNMGDLQARGMPNDVVSSVRVPAGWRVTLFEHHNFTGRSLELTADDACLITRGFNDLTSSVRVESSPAAAAQAAAP